MILELPSTFEKRFVRSVLRESGARDRRIPLQFRLTFSKRICMKPATQDLRIHRTLEKRIPIKMLKALKQI